ncbi:MAG: hypothetical protein KGS61_18760, partial [Verrucomicrobia bacterium]|nr:hypothetical protein [Verrucomicrobiota bacterium]
ELAERPDRKLLVELNEIILKACQPDPRHRYKSARQMHDELVLLGRGKSVREKHASQRRVRVLAWTGAVAAMSTFVTLGLERWLDWRVRLMQGRSSPINPALIDKIQPRDAAAPRDTIDLSAYYTAPLGEAWYPGPRDNTLASLPEGIRTFAGVTFDSRGLVQLAGGEISSYGATGYPPSVQGIPLDRWVKRLHFLQGTVSEAVDGARIGAYHVHYRSGRTTDIPIVYGRDLRALWQPADSSGTVSNSVVAWTGQNPATGERRLALRLYQQTWENPTPDDEIIALSFDSAMANSAPFLIALSCDEHPPVASTKDFGVNLSKALQAKAVSFERLPVSDGPGPCQFTRLSLNQHPLVLGDARFDGFRFNTPANGTMDLVWAFEASTNLHLQAWFILPLQGGMKVGFEDWYHGLSRTPKVVGGSPDLVLQFLSGKKLRPGRAYFIWFAFDGPQPATLEAALRFSRPGQIDPNKPESLVQAMGLEEKVAAERLAFHRHYCLGAVR